MVLETLSSFHEQYFDVKHNTAQGMNVESFQSLLYKSSVTEHKLKQLSIYNKSERSVNKKTLPFYNALSFFSPDKWLFSDLVRVFAWNAPTDLLEIVLHKFHIYLHNSVSTENSIYLTKELRR